MRTDRELLELAAKAAGYREFQYCETSGSWQAIYVHDGDTGFWMPLTDDGDALRLAVKLRLHFAACDHSAIASEPDGVFVQVPFGDDAAAATRRAIVMAAAKMAAQPYPTQHTDGGAVYG